MANDNYLEIGWLLNQDLHPKYWKKKDSELGGHEAADLFRIDPVRLKRHAVVFAQSGGGKSFLVGRLLEEVCLRTRAQCVVIDPNSDYARLNEVNKSIWDNPSYDDDAGAGVLPTDSSWEDFKSNWDSVEKLVWRGEGEEYDPFSTPSADIRLNVENLTPGMFVQQGSALDLLQIQHCIGFAETIITIERDYNPQAKGANALVQSIETYLSLARRLTESELQGYAYNEYGDSIKALEADARRLRLKVAGETEEEAEHRKERQIQQSRTLTFTRQRLRRYVSELYKSASFVGNDSVMLFSGKLYKLLEDELLYGTVRKETSPVQLNVLDLPTFAEDKRLILVGALLSQLWSRARKRWEESLTSESDTRVPMFIFVDEAHNLMPSDPQDAAYHGIREQFRKIAAEGRKLGLFLILITQRPDKLDSVVVSECENKMIMRVGSADVLDAQARILGFSASEAKDVLRFKPGRALCIGPWASTEGLGGPPQSFYCAARRTVQGGKDLDDAYWTSKGAVPAPTDLESYDPFADA